MSRATGWLKHALFEIQEYLRLVGEISRGCVSRPFYRRDVIEQLDVVGIGSLTVVVLTGVFTGMVLALQSGTTLDQYGARSVVGKLVAASMVRELGPVLTALMVTGRVGSGIAAELGSMVVTDQIAALRALGTDPIRKLVIPRVIAGTIMLPILTIISDGVGMFGGMIISVTQLRVTSSIYWANVVEGLFMADIWMGLIKPVVLGFALVTIGCHVGMRAHGGTQGVGRATTNAVVGASVVVLALDFFLTKLLIAVMYEEAVKLPMEVESQDRVRRAEDGEAPAIAFEEVSLAFDDNVVLDRISFTVRPGRTKVILGASGSGKSTILRLILGLLKPDGGRIFVAGERVDDMSEANMMAVRSQLGMVFQEGALFDSLTARENVGYRLYEETALPLPEVDSRVRDVLGFVGLGELADRMPSELSGGQRRRVAIARALTSRPRILLYDEPTTGLDPITAITVDDEIVKLRDLERVTSIVVTHQLRDAFYIATHQAVREDQRVTFEPIADARAVRTEFLMLRDGHVAFEGTAGELRASTDRYLQAFLS